MVVTFVTADTPMECAKVLSTKHLGKQRLEAYQIIRVLLGQQNGYKNHPICKMWYENVDGLKYYYNCCIDEWVARGFKNTMVKYDDIKDPALPWWFTNKQIQACHMASLVRKNDEYITKFNIQNYDSYLDHGYIWTGNLSEEQVLKMKESIDCPLKDICAPFGSGVPPQYRISQDIVERWVKNKEVNPQTGRTIKESGSVYKDYKKAAKFYQLL
jgi:hypothetical protein